jgi:hypothetical protein
MLIGNFSVTGSSNVIKVMNTIELSSDELRSVPRDQWGAYCVASVGGTDDVYISNGHEMLEMYEDSIVREQINPPVPSNKCDWQATFDDYDGAEDSPTRHQVGLGATEREAIDDLHLKANTTLLDVLEWNTKDLSGNAHDILGIRNGVFVKIRIKV